MYTTQSKGYGWSNANSSGKRLSEKYKNEFVKVKFLNRIFCNHGFNYHWNRKWINVIRKQEEKIDK